MTPDTDFWYPSVEDILWVHEGIIDDDPEAEPGIRDEEQIEFAISYVSEGHFGEVPETIHEKAFHLMRLLAANHYFVDGNKRTALGTTNLFYEFNGYELDYGDDLRALLKIFSVRQEMIDESVATEYMEEKTEWVGEITEEDLRQLKILEVIMAIGEALVNDHDDYTPSETREE
jgi:death-on-curing protein